MYSAVIPRNKGTVRPAITTKIRNPRKPTPKSSLPPAKIMVAALEMAIDSNRAVIIATT
jgi:hypothetical protein